jgi:NAD(P)-dependent dehydrogenase (short-subunit alcohol dehydrogenase family)
MEGVSDLTFEGKRIVVLGGSSGIGLATAQAAAKGGASVVIASSRRTRVDQALATLPAGGEGHALDLADEAAVQALFAMLGSFDHLVFTAGEALQLGSLASTDVDAARSFFGLRYWGAFLAAKYGSGSIRPGGSIVFTSGLAGKRPQAGWALAASMCSAMEGLTRALAVELVPIRVKTPVRAQEPRSGPPWARRIVRRSNNRRRRNCRGLRRRDRDRRLPLSTCQTYGTGQVLVVEARKLV